MHECRMLMLAVPLFWAPLFAAAADSVLSETTSEDVLKGSLEKATAVAVQHRIELIQAPVPTPAADKADAVELADNINIEMPKIKVNTKWRQCESTLGLAFARWSAARQRKPAVGFRDFCPGRCIGLLVSEVAEGERCILAFCRCSSHAAEGRNVLFSDGSIKSLSPKEFLAVLKSDAQARGYSIDQPAEATAERSAEIAATIARLGDDDFDERERAAQALFTSDQQARAPLEKAAESDNAEIARRACEILRKWRPYDPIIKDILTELQAGEELDQK